MIIQKQCYCGQKLEFESHEISGLNCPNCGRPVEALFPENKNKHSGTNSDNVGGGSAGGNEEEAGPAPPPADEREEEEVLKEVRKRSCYQTLRGLINLVVWAGYLICVLVAIAAIMGMAPQGKVNDKSSLILIGVSIAAIGVVLLRAAQEAMLLMIDAADLLIAERRDRLEREDRKMNEANLNG